MNPIVPLLLTLLIGVCSPQEPANRNTPEAEPRVFNKVERVGEESLRSFFMFSVGGHDYTIRADGRGERSFPNARSRNFTLKVDQSRIVQVSFLEHDGDLLLIYQLTDEHAYVVRLNQTTLKFLWLKPVKGLNFDNPVVESGILNLQVANGIVKLDLRSGAFLED